MDGNLQFLAGQLLPQLPNEAPSPHIPQALQIHFALNELTILLPSLSSWVVHPQ